MKILAIDPGTTESAYVHFVDGEVLDVGKVSNSLMLSILDEYDDCDAICIEMIASYGMPVGAEVFETCVWIGRFMEAAGPERVTRITRLKVKSFLCHSAKAKDANIRQALIDLLGPQGTKKAPGPTYGISGDMWAALSVAVAYQGGVR